MGYSDIHETRRLAIHKLAKAGLHVDIKSSTKELSAIIAQLLGRDIPATEQAQRSEVIAYVEGWTPDVLKVAPRPFEPLQKSRAWAEVEKRINMNYSPKHSAGRTKNHESLAKDR